MQPPQAGALLILERYLPHELDVFPCQRIIKARRAQGLGESLGLGRVLAGEV
jgi:hypothetical protein